MGRPKGATNAKVIEDIPRILDLIGKGKDDHEIRGELGFSLVEYSIRLKYIRENKIIQLTIADAALRAPLRMIEARRTAASAHDTFKTNPDCANAAMGALKLTVDIDKTLVELAEKFGILFLERADPAENIETEKTVLEKSDSDLLAEHNARLARLT